MRWQVNCAALVIGGSCLGLLIFSVDSRCDGGDVALYARLGTRNAQRGLNLALVSSCISSVTL